ncbi:hypothetical protein BDV23DRAFT_149537 [Aspergillus alliaceus]|uniref:Uncharacterized protein n=1 Tax=Petromyces alliaceus TaxID=209559 RepID=A0A5N6FSI8_PETAA|nr:uncharacterized protein BDW43DRAFT_279400 [Aspergillus alliaceus]KAB8232429.1 hypothetical protein BDW43DRAFT_279400 [Aspergillus alliaceus]KAE8393360.1 hypothetical protein BDV23DRAFT_149537 [Aspergillus alliaceus]
MVSTSIRPTYSCDRGSCAMPYSLHIPRNEKRLHQSLCHPHPKPYRCSTGMPGCYSGPSGGTVE